ncbi:hypothetical protein [Aeropyrum camini]|uniref:hypothetical protein n=1 Tax=Aeropyrum camini TaxID=229980 RepID=UPI0011E59654|nr:hypothetical protein [Aeropyrum camini]
MPIKSSTGGTYSLLQSPLEPEKRFSGEATEGTEDLLGRRVASEISFAFIRCKVCGGMNVNATI